MQQFTLMDAHITLLRHANVSWNGMEYGAPAIDPKRPYGNGDVVSDVAAISGIDPVPTDDNEIHWPPGTSFAVEALHRQLEVALQIVLHTGEFVAGKYEASDCKRDWRLIRDDSF